MTPHQAIADAVDGPLFDPEKGCDEVADIALTALSACGFQVVTDNLVDAAERVLYVVDGDLPADRLPVLDRLAACLAAHRGDDELNVFTEGGA